MNDCRDWEVPCWIKQLPFLKLVELLDQPVKDRIDAITKVQVKRELDERLKGK